MKRASEAERIENNLIVGFQRSVKRFPGRPALDVNNKVYTYEQLGSMAAGLMRKIVDLKSKKEKPVALLAYRSPAAYAGIIGILGAGHGYVPLHPEFPAERNFKILDLGRTTVMIVSGECQNALDWLLKFINYKMTFILVDVLDAQRYAEDHPRHRFIIVKDLHVPDAGQQATEPVSPDDIAYLLFTSGSTGEPKGVPVSHHNARSYVKFVTKRYDINEKDLVSQMHDMTFDNSIHDIFVAWETGACLCVPTKEDKILPVNFIQKKKITLWFSVPSVASMIDTLGCLEPNIFPSLRYSFFAGEALYKSIAQKWQKASPHSKLINTYGPTETTVTITYYDWDNATSPAQCLHGIVPLGLVFDGNRGRVVREDGQGAGIDEPGELYLSGCQVTKEYWNDPTQTKAHYETFPDTGDTLWYRSGDLVRQGENGCLYYLGRIDNQVKIRGNRIELGEIESVLLSQPDINEAAVIGVSDEKIGKKIKAVIVLKEGSPVRENDIKFICSQKLPVYMIPEMVVFKKSLPKTSSNKIDRRLLEMEEP